MTRAKTKPDKAKTQTGGYARGEAARSKLIEVAIDTFGRQGFELSTTRLIAKTAKVNLGAIQYYFGGKEGIYLACAEHIASTVEARILALSSRIEETLAPQDAPQKAHVEALWKVWDAAASQIVGVGKQTGWVMFISREQIAPGKAFGILYKRVVSRLIAMFSLHVGRVLAKPADSEEVLLHTLALLSPLFLLQRAPGTALKALNWPDLEGDRLHRAKALLFQHALYGLQRPQADVAHAGSVPDRLEIDRD